MSHFFALISRMKYINRWSLMRNTTEESLSVHAQDVAVIAHALAVIGNRRFGKEYNAERAALLAIYHDAGEIITGDMPTPVKYGNPALKEAYKAVERVADEKLLSALPEDLRDEYTAVLFGSGCGDEALLPLVKAADKLSALIKCIEELKMGNAEFSVAAESTKQAVLAMQLPEAEVFISEFLGSYALPLDELTK